MNGLKIKTEIRQKQIREAALGIIDDEGLHKLTIAAIAEKVGITKSNIYRHYSGKNDIIVDIIKMINLNLQKVVSDSAHIEPVLKRLKYIFLSHLVLLEKNKGAPLIIFTNKSYMNNSNIKITMTQTMKSYINSVQGIMRNGINDGSLRSNLNVDSIGVTYLGLIQSIILQWIISNGSFSPEERGKEVWRIFISGISCFERDQSKIQHNKLYKN